jgi:hypothetical protein
MQAPQSIRKDRSPVAAEAEVPNTKSQFGAQNGINGYGITG